MAFENLEPHTATITGLRAQRRGLAQIVDILSDQHGVETSTGTLSRFLKSKGLTHRDLKSLPRETTPQEESLVDTQTLLTELLVEITRRSDEQRAVSEAVAGKLAVLSADIQELEKAVTSGNKNTYELTQAPTARQPAQSGQSISTRVLFKIWRRALFYVTLCWLIGIVAVTWWILDRKGIKFGDAITWLAG